LSESGVRSHRTSTLNFLIDIMGKRDGKVEARFRPWFIEVLSESVLGSEPTLNPVGQRGD
jgi:hypothetical protein